MSPEQEVRDILERMEVENAQSMTAGDVVELADIIARLRYLEKMIFQVAHQYWKTMKE